MKKLGACKLQVFDEWPAKLTEQNESNLKKSLIACGPNNNPCGWALVLNSFVICAGCTSSSKWRPTAFRWLHWSLPIRAISLVTIHLIWRRLLTGIARYKKIALRLSWVWLSQKLSWSIDLVATSVEEFVLNSEGKFESLKKVIRIKLLLNL